MASEQRLEASVGDTGLGREECLKQGQPSLTRLGTGARRTEGYGGGGERLCPRGPLWGVGVSPMATGSP